MSYQPHYIASFEDDSGLSTYYEPFLLPEKAFPKLEDAYAWRGKVRRRIGFNYLGRLRRELTNESEGTVGAANPMVKADILTSVRATEPNAELQTGTVSIILDRGNANETTYIDNGFGTFTMQVGGTYTISASSINYATGAISLTFTVVPGAAVTVEATFFYYPGLPVMALPTRQEDLINAESLVAFDTKYAYKFISNQFQEIDPAKTWHGDDKDFFWTTTYWPDGPSSSKYLWATNFNKSATPDTLGYFNGNVWTPFTPLVTATNTLYTCELIIPYKNRLLFFNTWEGTTAGGIAGATNFPQRMRFSQVGNPTIAATSWLSDVVGKGGFVDCPTDQTIISVEFIKDVLVVKCERSSWKVIYTGNATFPFYFEKVNTELGAESTFSLVPFDRGIFSVGNVGICTDDSVNVYRIDQNVPQTVFKIKNSENGPERVHGIRDFSNEIVYWAYPNAAEKHKFPNKVLVYNYINQSYAIFNDSFTCYGYFQNTTDKVWSDYTDVVWGGANFAWNSGSQQARYPDVVAGNQQGFVLLLNQKIPNDFSLAINSITIDPVTGYPTFVSFQHNLIDQGFITLSNIVGTGTTAAPVAPFNFPQNPNRLNGLSYKVTVVDNNTFTLEWFNDDPTVMDFENVSLVPGGTYLGSGRIAQVNNINISTKVFAPYYENGAQVRLGYLDFLTSKTQNGEITCDIYVNDDNSSSLSEISATNGLLGSNRLLTKPENTTLIPMQANQSKIMHRFFVQAFCQNFQIVLTMNDYQMVHQAIANSEIMLHAMIIYLSRNARMTQ